MPDRSNALRRFAVAALADSALHIAPASSDASFRSYWRVTRGDGSTRILMDAPPDKENLEPWLDVATRLRAAGLHAPEVFAVDRAQGFVLMEDLGARTLLGELSEATVDRLYGVAMEDVARLHAVDTQGLPRYDRERLVAEMELMPEWFLKRHLGFAPSCEEWDVIEAAFTVLAHAALEQPRVFVHRDFHSRNLLLGHGGSDLAIIDFQDAVAGPVTYDLVSLLRDCYVEWDDARVVAWARAHHTQLRERGLVGGDVEAEGFLRWFDLMGLQRHLKVLGIFCRLWYRDGKRQYLGDLPLVWRYVERVGARHAELAALVELLRRALGARDITIPRTESAT